MQKASRLHMACSTHKVVAVHSLVLFLKKLTKTSLELPFFFKILGLDLNQLNNAVYHLYVRAKRVFSWLVESLLTEST